MGKDYDYYITPQNTRRLKQKKYLYLSVVGVFVITSLLITFLSPGDRALGIVGMVWAVLQTVMQMLERRKEHWTWGYILVWCFILFGGSVASILVCGLYWCLALWVIEIAVCVVLAVCDHKKQGKIKKKR